RITLRSLAKCQSPGSVVACRSRESGLYLPDHAESQSNSSSPSVSLPPEPLQPPPQAEASADPGRPTLGRRQVGGHPELRQDRRRRLAQGGQPGAGARPLAVHEGGEAEAGKAFGAVGENAALAH